MRSIATIFAVAALVVSARGDDKKADPVDGKKLLGKWELKEKRNAATILTEFTKDGEVIITNTGADGEASVIRGTYKLDGATVVATTKVDGTELKKTLTVSKLTDSDLVLTPEQGPEMAFVRRKEK